ncbi:transposase [Ensifer sp. SSB1]|uniref:IS66-like element accessory protein TnpA n=1 Tax=Ensifer sp. SSB1 TaxID=2795385 RepID=UPI001A4BADE3|nr:transposase [Ensifer sp. SSB1]MBK5571820.1 transposase [Ensifer sp. SSB1]
MKIVDTNSGAPGAPFRVRVNRTGRRTFSREYKLEVIRECSAHGASVAGVALSHRINANLVRRWIVQHRSGRLFTMPPLLPVTLAESSSVPVAEAKPAPSGIIEIELHGACVRIRGAVDTAALRAVLEALKR